MPKAIRQSLNRSGLDYINLYLLHDAISGKERRIQAYKCLLDARDRGQIRSVGVSNWNMRHLEELEQEGLELPVVNQIELHPFCQQVSSPCFLVALLFADFNFQTEIVAYCRAKGIAIQAYCPLIRGERFQDPIIADITSKLGRTAAQVLLRWSLQHDFVPVPKSSSSTRIGERDTQ